MHDNVLSSSKRAAPLARFRKRVLRDFIAAEMAPACEDIILEQIARIRATDEVHEVSSVCARFAVD